MANSNLHVYVFVSHGDQTKRLRTKCFSKKRKSYGWNGKDLNSIQFLFVKQI